MANQKITELDALTAPDTLDEVVIVDKSDTTMSADGTNKRMTFGTLKSVKRVTTEASSATPTINTDITDLHRITALAANITSFTTNLSGTPVVGQQLLIEVTPTATRTVTFGASFEAGNVHALPTEFTGTDTVLMGFTWNSITSKWRLIALDN
jgi:hypothetical protein